jgi:hypothetical protein
MLSGSESSFKRSDDSSIFSYKRLQSNRMIYTFTKLLIPLVEHESSGVNEIEKGVMDGI